MRIWVSALVKGGDWHTRTWLDRTEVGEVTKRSTDYAMNLFMGAWIWQVLGNGKHVARGSYKRRQTDPDITIVTEHKVLVILSVIACTAGTESPAVSLLLAEIANLDGNPARLWEVAWRMSVSIHVQQQRQK